MIYKEMFIYIYIIYYIIFIILYLYIILYLLNLYIYWDKDGQWCNGFITGFIWISTKCTGSLANHLRAVADMFRP